MAPPNEIPLTAVMLTWEPYSGSEELQLLRPLNPFRLTEASSAVAIKPRVMLLQGPVGPFFRQLQQALVERDFDVIKVNFNGGDRLFSAEANAFDFKGTPAEWHDWLNTFVAENSPAAIVMFGDGRPYHVEALRVAADNGIAVWCLEEGYIRPDYITCERDGNNANSLLRRPVARHATGHVASAAAIGNSFRAMAIYGALYAISQAVLAKPFKGNARHRQRPLRSECRHWALGFTRKFVFYPANSRVLNRIINGDLRDYFVVALQVHDDLNLQRNGGGWTMERLIDEVARSFATHAPANRQLVFKAHPLDRGHRPYRKLVARAAKTYGIHSRVHIVDDGPIGQMIRHSDGLVTVNSTSGLLALQQGKPLLALGSAAYSTAALNPVPVGLDLFWRDATSASAEVVQGFVDRMKRESLINGSFYLSAFAKTTAAAVADRIQDGLISDNLNRLLAMARDLGRRNNESKHERLAG